MNWQTICYIAASLWSEPSEKLKPNTKGKRERERRVTTHVLVTDFSAPGLLPRRIRRRTWTQKTERLIKCLRTYDCFFDYLYPIQCGMKANIYKQAFSVPSRDYTYSNVVLVVFLSQKIISFIYLSKTSFQSQDLLIKGLKDS